MMPVFLFPIKLVLIALPVLLVGALLAAVASRGVGMLKKQGVAWLLTIAMIAAAVGIGYAKAPFNNRAPDSPPQDYPAENVPPAAAGSFVWDDAGVLSAPTVRTLDQRNERLWNKYSVTIGVVTCSYGADDLDQYAMKRAEEMGLGGYDMIVVLDILGDNYWLFQGNDISRAFTNQDCSDYAYEYMEYDFARGSYGDGLLNLTEALEAWYENYFD